MMSSRPIWGVVFALLSISFVGGAVAQEDVGWNVTLEDEQGGHGVNYIHVITEGWVRVYKPAEEGERDLLHEVELDRDAMAVIRRALNAVPVDDLEESYHGAGVLSSCVHFVFDLPGQERVESTVWSGARIACLQRVIEAVNRFVPRDCRLRGHRG